MGTLENTDTVNVYNNRMALMYLLLKRNKMIVDP